MAASAAAKKASQVAVEVEFVKCECCGLTEECTAGYIAGVRERHEGRWICGLCAEAVKDETLRSAGDIGTDEAIRRHMKFCEQFKSCRPPVNPAEDLISAMKNLLWRSLDSPRKNDSAFRGSKSCLSWASK